MDEKLKNTMQGEEEKGQAKQTATSIHVLPFIMHAKLKAAWGQRHQKEQNSTIKAADYRVMVDWFLSIHMQTYST